MSDVRDNAPLFTSEELAEMAAAAAEIQRDFDEYSEWLQSPEGQLWCAAQFRELSEIADAFQQECKAGEILTAEDLEQLQRDGIFVSHRKKGRDDG